MEVLGSAHARQAAQGAHTSSVVIDDPSSHLRTASSLLRILFSSSAAIACLPGTLRPHATHGLLPIRSMQVARLPPRTPVRCGLLQTAPAASAGARPVRLALHRAATTAIAHACRGSSRTGSGCASPISAAAPRWRPP